MTKTADHFPCAQCGANLAFDPTANQLACGYCGHKTFVEPRDPSGDTKIQEVDYARALRKQLSSEEVEETRVSRCDSCGASVQFESDVHAKNCAFCDSPIVTDTGTDRHFKPRGILPFALTEKEARSALKNWFGKLWFAPSELGKYARAGRPMRGIYTPFWTFDADTQSEYSGARGDTYYVTERVSVIREGRRVTETRQVPKIRWTNVRGRVRRFFDDILILASRNLDDRDVRDLGGWDLHDLMPYNTGYLAGFGAESYTVDIAEGFAESRAIMDLAIRRDVRFDIGGDHQRIHHLHSEVDDVTFKHILLPIWIASYRYRGKVYRFIVNGRTGQVTGRRPYSVWKIAFAVLLGLIFAIIIGAFMAANGHI